jgi:hypothetical protein
MTIRKVATDNEAAEITDKAWAAVEAAVGPGGGIVILPVEHNGSCFLTIMVKGDTVAEKMVFMRRGIEAIVTHLVHTHRVEHEGDPQLDAQGIGVTPPPEIYAAGQLAMESLKDLAAGILIVVHRSTPDANGELTGGVMAVVSGDQNPDEHLVLAEIGPKLVERWAQRTLEEVKTRSGPKQ